MGSKRWKLNKADGAEIVKFILYTVVASILTTLSEVSHMIDFGQYQYIATAVLIPGLVFIKRAWTDYAKLE